MARILPEGLERWLRNREYAEMVLESVAAVASCCNSLDLSCRDPPAVSSGLLQSLGYGQYRVRSFWSRLPLGTMDVVLYRYEESEWALRLVHDRGPVCEVECEGLLVPLDKFDCKRVGTVFTPNSHRLFLRVWGHVEGNRVEANLIRILVLLEEALPGSLDTIVSLARGALWGRGESGLRLLEKIAGFIERWEGILEFFLPYVPRGLEGLERASPIVRFILSSRKRRRS